MVTNFPTKLTTWFKFNIWQSRRGIQDVVISMIPQLVTVVTGFITSVLIARGLGPAGMGQYALVQSISSLAASLSDLGVGQTAIRYASQAIACNDTLTQHAVLRWAFRLRIILIILVTLAFFVLAPILANSIWHSTVLTPLIRLGLFVGIFTALASVPMIYFQSRKQFGMNAAVLVGQSLMAFGGILVLAWFNHWSVSGVITTTLVSTGLGALVFLLLIPKTAILVRQDFAKLTWQNFWRSPQTNPTSSSKLDDTSADKFAFFMLLSTVIVMLTLRADVWLMGIFLDNSQIGIYSVAMRFTLPLTIILNGLNTALWPRASGLTKMTETVTLLKKTFKLSLWVALGGVVYAIFVPLIAPWIFGDKYASSVFLAQLLSLRYCLAILTCPVGVISYSFGFVRILWLINLVQFIVVVFANILLLPVHGPIGSAIALIINDTIGLLVMGILTTKYIHAKQSLL